MWERQRESQCENENSMSSFNPKSSCFIKNVNFSLERCTFGANSGVLHYVLRRKIVLLKKWQFWVGNVCKTARRTHGTAARSVPVAEMLASETRRDRTRGRALSAYNDPSLCLFPGDRSRESCGTWQLPQITIQTPKTTCKSLLGTARKIVFDLATPYSINSLFSELFRKFGGVFGRVFETI